MAKIDRFSGNVQAFAINNQSGEKYLFGSSVTDSNSLTDQLTTEYLRGWATVGASEFPPLEWFNAAMFTSTQFNSYLHQMGVAEWNADQEYPTAGAMCVYAGLPWIRNKSWMQGDEPGVTNSWSTVSAENRAKGNQRWNVAGKDGHSLPNPVATVYPAGDEIVAGVTAITECTLTYENEILSGTGTYKRTVSGEFPNDFYGVKKSTGLIDQAGTTLSASDGVTELEVTMDTAGPHKFPQMSEQKGAAPDVSDLESRNEYYYGSSSGNYEEILEVGAYTSGTFLYPYGRTEDDYQRIEVFADSDFSGTIENQATLTAERIPAWATLTSYTVSGVFCRLTRVSPTQFSVSVSGSGSVSQVIGYLKPGVL